MLKNCLYSFVIYIQNDIKSPESSVDVNSRSLKTKQIKMKLGLPLGCLLILAIIQEIYSRKIHEVDSTGSLLDQKFDEKIGNIISTSCRKILVSVPPHIKSLRYQILHTPIIAMMISIK